MTVQLRSDACDRCLRRAYLLAFLAPRIAALLNRSGSRVPGLLALPDAELMEAASGADPAAAHRYLAALSLPEERERCQRHGVSPFCRHSAAYPPALADLDDPPAVVFTCGDPHRLTRLTSEPIVALVGTRRPSPYGLEVAYGLGRGLGAAGVPVVSGLALGIDGIAHRGCLDRAGTPIAVLAGGADVPYPRRHRGLHRRVVDAGLVISEMPPGARAFRWSFPARNRIMAALAQMTIVIEAAQPSGSLITADFARDLGRTVGAVPGRVTWRMAGGVNQLLRDGAVPVTSAQDALDELFGVGARAVPEATAAAALREPGLQVVLEHVEAGRPIDQIAAAAKLSAGQTRAALGRLEAEGWVVRRSLTGWERVAR